MAIADRAGFAEFAVRQWRDQLLCRLELANEQVAAFRAEHGDLPLERIESLMSVRLLRLHQQLLTTGLTLCDDYLNDQENT